MSTGWEAGEGGGKSKSDQLGAQLFLPFLPSSSPSPLPLHPHLSNCTLGELKNEDVIDLRSSFLSFFPVFSPLPLSYEFPGLFFDLVESEMKLRKLLVVQMRGEIPRLEEKRCERGATRHGSRKEEKRDGEGGGR